MWKVLRRALRRVRKRVWRVLLMDVGRKLRQQKKRIRFALYLDGPKRCCRQEENRVLQPGTRPGLKLNVCKVCSCRHFEATVDPGKFSLQGS